MRTATAPVELLRIGFLGPNPPNGYALARVARFEPALEPFRPTGRAEFRSISREDCTPDQEAEVK